MATKYLKLRAVVVLIGCGALLPVACGGDDDSNPTPSTGGTGANGGSGNKGGSSNKGGTAGDAGTGDTGTGGTANKGGSGNKGGSSTGGSSTGGSSNPEAGTGAAPEAGTNGNGVGGSTGGSTGGTNNVQAGNGGEGNQPEPTGCTAADLTGDDCFANCDPKQTDDSLEFLNYCHDGKNVLGGVAAECQPWDTVLAALGPGCKKLGSGCELPPLP